jgi:hypothetical protein
MSADRNRTPRAAWGRLLAHVARCWNAYVRWRRAAERSAVIRTFEKLIGALGGALFASLLGAHLGERIAGHAGRDLLGWVFMVLGAPCGWGFFRLLHRWMDALDDRE